jgi:pyruvate/2-oxoglutarate dehydrogenase complex dihydrolipoamide acyltransferase (E2) component
MRASWPEWATLTWSAQRSRRDAQVEAQEPEPASAAAEPRAQLGAAGRRREQVEVGGPRRGRRSRPEDQAIHPSVNTVCGASLDAAATVQREQSAERHRAGGRGPVTHDTRKPIAAAGKMRTSR